jgi:chromosome segregation ATPase
MMQANEMLEQRVMERTTSLERHAVEMHELQDKMYAMRQRLQAMEKFVHSLPEQIGSILATPAVQDGKVGQIESQLAQIREMAEKLAAMAKQ